ncbi:hypothetical protein ACIPYR_35130 [Streptomyces parvus]|uniref:hypothetical protein n=1 Tax=Streptomyces parvus TaxID=66428 RepID=UPI0037F74E4D
MTKPRFTIDQHEHIDMRLATIRDELLNLYVDVSRAYPKAGPEARHLGRAYESVDKARCELESAMFREHPEQGSTSVYYPPSETRR